MGIKYFSKLLKMYDVKYHKDNISHFSDQIIGVDIMIPIYSLAHIVMKDIDVNEFIDFYQNTRDVFLLENFIWISIEDIVVNIIVNKLKGLKNSGIFPVVVFDGIQRKEKGCTLKNRNKTINKNRADIKDAFERFEIGNIIRKLIVIKRKTIYFKIYKDMKAENIPVLIANHDAEELCAILDKKGIIDGTWTKDSDYIIFGGRTQITDIKRENGSYTFTYLLSSEIYNKIADYEILVLIGIVLGCDFLPKGVYGIGIKKAKEYCENISEIDKEELADIFNIFYENNNSITSYYESLIY